MRSTAWRRCSTQLESMGITLPLVFWTSTTPSQAGSTASRSTPSSASSPGTAYAISNRGSQTLFTADHATKERPLLIRPFDDFQENLLRNYDFYCKLVCKTTQTAAIRPGR